MILDADVRVLHEALLEQAVRGEKFVELAVDDVLDGLRRLALGLFLGDGLLLGHQLGVDLVPAHRHRRGGGDVQGDVLYQRLEVFVAEGVLLASPDLKQHADLGPGVDVRSHQPGAVHLELGVAGEQDVLADLGHLRGAQLLEVGARLSQFELGQFTGELQKLLVLGDEVGLAVDLNQHAGLGVGLDVVGDDALIGLSTGLLGGLDRSLRTEHVDGGLDVAIGLNKGFFAVHQACAGHAAKLRDEFCCYLCHNRFCLIIDLPPAGMAGREILGWRPD